MRSKIFAGSGSCSVESLALCLTCEDMHAKNFFFSLEACRKEQHRDSFTAGKGTNRGRIIGPRFWLLAGPRKSTFSQPRGQTNPQVTMEPNRRLWQGRRTATMLGEWVL